MLKKLISSILVLTLIFTTVNPIIATADEDYEGHVDYEDYAALQEAPEDDDTEGDPAYIEIEANKRIFSFGHVSKGTPVPYQELTITSRSSETIYIDYQLCDAEDVFFLSTRDSMSLAPGQSATFYIGMDETKPEGYYTANLIVCPLDYISETINIGISAEIVDDKPIITYIGIKPSNIDMSKNSSYRFTEDVRGENNPNYGVDWKVEGNTSANTSIDSDGILKIGQDENASQLTVRATSVQDSSKIATASVKVQEGNYRVSTQSNPSNGGNTGGGGTFLPGSYVEVYAAPNNGFRFVKWTKDGQTVSTNAKYQIKSINENYNLIANFEQVNCYVKVKSTRSEGGTISQSGNVNYNGSYNLTAAPNTGFDFEGWYENGKRISTERKLTINNIVTNREFTANFVQNTYKVQLQVNPQGTGVVSGDGSFKKGSNVTIAAKALDGYEFDCWSVNGNLLSRDATCTLSKVDNDYVVVANFKKKSAITYTISSNIEGGQGAISPEGMVIVPEGMDVTYTFAPAKNYTISSVTIDGKSVGAVPSYTFKNIKENHSVGVKFSQIVDAHVHSNNQAAKSEEKKEEKHKDLVDNSNVTDTSSVENEEEYKPNNIEEAVVDSFLKYTELRGILQEYNISEEEARGLIRNKMDVPLLERACEEQFLAVSVANEYSENKFETESRGYNNLSSTPNFEEVIDSLLTEEEKIDILNGGHIAINFNLFANNKLETGDNKLLVNRAIKDKVEIGSFFEAVLLKDTGAGSEMVTELSVPMKIVIDIPQNLKAEGREFYIMRAHKNEDGTVDIEYLDNESTDNNKIVFSTSKFSSYAIAYSGGRSETLTQSDCVKILFVAFATAVLITVILIVVLLRINRRKRKKRENAIKKGVNRF